MGMRLVIFALILTWILGWPKSQREELVHAFHQAMHPSHHLSTQDSAQNVSFTGIVFCVVILAVIWFALVPTE